MTVNSTDRHTAMEDVNEHTSSPRDGQPPVDVWPLRLVDLDDLDQMNLLYRLFQFSPHVTFYYLSDIIFPSAMGHQGLKISACGQEVLSLSPHSPISSRPLSLLSTSLFLSSNILRCDVISQLYSFSLFSWVGRCCSSVEWDSLGRRARCCRWSWVSANTKTDQMGK
jgi:hypothetical protein